MEAAKNQAANHQVLLVDVYPVHTAVCMQVLDTPLELHVNDKCNRLKVRVDTLPEHRRQGATATAWHCGSVVPSE